MTPNHALTALVLVLASAALAGAQATGLRADAVMELDVVGRYIELPAMKLPGPARYQFVRIYSERPK